MVIRKTVVRNINVKIASTIFRKIMFSIMPYLRQANNCAHKIKLWNSQYRTNFKYFSINSYSPYKKYCCPIETSLSDIERKDL